MHKPRTALRSLLATTCGATLLATAVLGTGSAAFAEAEDPQTAIETTADAAAEAGAPPAAVLGAEEPSPDEEPPADSLTEGDTPVSDAGWGGFKC